MNRSPRPACACVVAIALMGAIAGACTSSADAGGNGSGACAGVEILVAASDYSSSVLCGAPTCTLGPGTTGEDLGRDPSLATSHGRAFYLARDMDQIIELDPKCGTPHVLYPVKQADVVGTSNVHDVAAADDGSIWAVLYGAARIAIVNKDRTAGGTIDLSSYDGDKNPEADAIRIVSVNGVEKAFVTLERLTREVPSNALVSKQTSEMLRIDVATRQVEATITLAGRNPFNAMAEQDGALFMAEPRDFDTANEAMAGIERFDTATSTTRLLVKEQDLGGSVSEVAVTDGCGAALVAGPAPNVNPTSLVTFDPASGQVLTTAAAPVFGPTSGYDLEGLAWRGNTLFVGDRRSNGAGYRVHVFERDPGTCVLRETTANPIDLPQRPVALRPAH